MNIDQVDPSLKGTNTSAFSIAIPAIAILCHFVEDSFKRGLQGKAKWTEVVNGFPFIRALDFSPLPLYLRHKNDANFVLCHLFMLITFFVCGLHIRKCSLLFSLFDALYAYISIPNTNLI